MLKKSDEIWNELYLVLQTNVQYRKYKYIFYALNGIAILSNINDIYTLTVFETNDIMHQLILI